MHWSLQHRPSSPGLAARRTASLPLAYDQATQYSKDATDQPLGRGVLDPPLSRRMTVEYVAGASVHWGTFKFDLVWSSQEGWSEAIPSLFWFVAAATFA